LKNANIPPEQVAAYIGLAGLSEQQIKVAITLSNEAEVRARFDALVAYMGATKDPTAVLTDTGKAVNEAVAQAVSGGNFGLLRRFWMRNGRCLRVNHHWL
jgi:N-acetylglucosamine kinase-like BadF-type ATPase